MNVSADQLQAEDLGISAAFLQKASQYLREEFPDKTAAVTQDDLKQMIMRGVLDAAEFELLSEAEAMGFVDLQWRWSHTFHADKSYPWVKHILEDNMMQGDEKIDALQNAFCLHEAATMLEE
jgi:hypothetical protein